jgi:Protein of unknown function, DUF547
MKKIIGLFLVSLLMGCAAIPEPRGADANASGAPPYDAWARVLQKHVDVQGRVNFAAVAVDRADLDQFVSYVYATAPANRPAMFPTPAHVLAFHINAYNALAMHKVIATGIPETLGGLRKVGFFALGKVQVGGEAISLYDYENKVIRALKDPRIHFALNCMSVSCPRLPREVFLAETLDAQLDRETRAFFAEARNTAIDDAKQVVTLSEILKFYPEDFLRVAPSLTAYANRYRDAKIPENYKVVFADYDWTVNRQPTQPPAQQPRP